MRQIISNFLSMITAATLITGCGTTPSAPTIVERPSAEEVKALTQKAADWQIDHYKYQTKYRAQPRQPDLLVRDTRYEYPNNSNITTILYDGIYKFATIADDSTKYIDWITEQCETCDYKLDNDYLKTENQAIVSIYVKLARSKNNPSLYEDSQIQIDKSLDIVNYKAPNWQKCDLLYATAPAYAELSAITGDKRYIEYMDQQIHRTFDILYDPEQKLYNHDRTYFSKSDEDGNKLFWARGSGWVLAALAKIIPQFEEGSESQKFYIERFQELANRLSELQLPNGAWPLYLLSKDEEGYIIESSSASLITYGLAWGVNNGILDSDKFEQPLFRAWYALAKSVDEEGMVGYSQCESDMSCNLSPKFTELFTGGAFINAGSELYLYLNK